MRLIFRIVLALLLFLATIWFVTSQPLFLKPAKVSTPNVSAKTLESNVRFLSESAPSRLGKEVNLQPTIVWIEQQLKAYGNTTLQSYRSNSENFHNIILEFGPKTEEIIVVGAHYDTAHGYPGADDNASGVAALIELARLLSKNSEKLKHRVQLVFYTLEEPPYFRTDKMGSYIHATQLKQQKQKVKLMIALDMIGYFTDEDNSQELPFPLMDKVYPTQGNFIAIVGNLSNMFEVRKVKRYFQSATELPVYSFNAPQFVTGIDFSDHLNFWYHDYPAVMVTDTSFNRNKNYHTELDTADKLDFEKMAEVIKALYQTVISLADE